LVTAVVLIKKTYNIDYGKINQRFFIRTILLADPFIFTAVVAVE